MVANLNLDLHQMDVKMTFLDGYLQEEIDMNQLEGYVKVGNKNKVYNLIKIIYGFKQIPHAWYK